MIDKNKIYVPVIPLKATDGETYGNEVRILAVTTSYVVFQTASPYLNKPEEVLEVKEFEKTHITVEEKSRRVKSALDKVMRKLEEIYAPNKAKLGEPVQTGYLTYKASNDVVIRFDEMGHVNFPPCGTSNPLSSFDVPWVAAKSKALRDEYDRVTRSLSSRYGYNRYPW